MAVFVDQVQTWETGQWCHMWSDRGDWELHAMARRIGLLRSWHQVSHGWFSHYDLRPGKRALALRHGALEGDLRTLIAARAKDRKTNGSN